MLLSPPHFKPFLISLSGLIHFNCSYVVEHKKRCSPLGDLPHLSTPNERMFHFNLSSGSYNNFKKFDSS